MALGKSNFRRQKYGEWFWPVIMLGAGVTDRSLEAVGS